jgi:hypothetical protein
MPIRPELRPLYPPHWRELSSHVRFERAGGKCQRCGRPHLALLRCLPDGRWFDEQAATWRDRRGRPARWPDLMEATRLRMTRVVLAAAHLDGDPTNNRRKNLRALCQRCHMLHDQPHHLAQRWITYRRRQAVGDLFLGQYPTLIAALASKRTTGELGYAGSVSPGPPYAALDARAVRAALRGGAALRALSIAGRSLPVRTAAPEPRLPGWLRNTAVCCGLVRVVADSHFRGERWIARCMHVFQGLLRPSAGVPASRTAETNYKCAQRARTANTAVAGGDPLSKTSPSVTKMS